MADNIFAAASTTGQGSSERIASEFMAQGAPTNPANVTEGSVLGGIEVMTPRVGTGFVQWAISGYDLEGKTQNHPDGVNYNKKGDWMYDKNVGNVDGGTDNDNYKPTDKK